MSTDGKYLRGCPAEVWDGPYLFRCGHGIDECAQHGPFTPARRCTKEPRCRWAAGHGGRCS